MLTVRYFNANTFTIFNEEEIIHYTKTFRQEEEIVIKIYNSN